MLQPDDAATDEREDGSAARGQELSLIMIMFTEPAERAKAMGVFGFVLSGGGPLAALNGGYHAAFLVSALFAVAAAVLGTVFLSATAATAPTDAESAAAPRAD
jgi:hypothetical protein